MLAERGSLVWVPGRRRCAAAESRRPSRPSWSGRTGTSAHEPAAGPLPAWQTQDVIIIILNITIMLMFTARQRPLPETYNQSYPEPCKVYGATGKKKHRDKWLSSSSSSSSSHPHHHHARVHANCGLPSTPNHGHANLFYTTMIHCQQRHGKTTTFMTHERRWETWKAKHWVICLARGGEAQ